jgi:uncharacterized protein GlcG (DUF336 family)
MAENPYLSFDQVRAAMNAMTEKALELPNEPVAMAIVDDTGNMVAYAKMDNLRMFSRRHAIRKAYTSAMMGQDSGAHGDNVRAGGRIVADMGDSMLTPNQGGLVIRKDGVILGGIGVGGYPSGQRDEDLARVGLDAMNL